MSISSVGSMRYPSCASCSTLQIWPSGQASALCTERVDGTSDLCLCHCLCPLADHSGVWLKCGSALPLLSSCDGQPIVGPSMRIIWACFCPLFACCCSRLQSRRLTGMRIFKTNTCLRVWTIPAKQGIRGNVNAAAGWSVDPATDDTVALALSATAILLCHVSKPLRTPQFCLCFGASGLGSGFPCCSLTRKIRLSCAR